MLFFKRIVLFASFSLMAGAVTAVSASSSSDFSSHSSSRSSSHSHAGVKRCKGTGWHSLKGAHHFFLYSGHQVNEKKLVASFSGHELANLQAFLTKSGKHSHFFLVAVNERGEAIHSGKLLVKGGRVKFCQPPCVLSHLLPLARVGEAYEAEIEVAKRSSSATFKLVHGTLPQGLKLSSKGILFGVPQQEGRFEFVVQATSRCGASRNVTLRLQVGCPTVNILTKELADGSVSVAYSQSIAVLDSEGDTTFALLTGELPAGLTLSAQGVISGTPTEAGTYNFIVEATNACGYMATAAYALIIDNPCSAPVFVTTTLPETEVLLTYSQQIETEGGTAPIVFTLVSGSLPSEYQLYEEGLIFGTTAIEGIYNFTVEARSACGAASTQAFTLNVGSSG